MSLKYKVFYSSIVLVELPGLKAAGLIGRVWMWKPNKLPRKGPKIARRGNPSKNCKPWELSH